MSERPLNERQQKLLEAITRASKNKATGYVENPGDLRTIHQLERRGLVHAVRGYWRPIVEDS